uniref:Reverse transcriptase domain-containing protein n=1 Tax=Caenorhabditis japonica TaxID=281687 RepID=A0A8R1ENQ3_CAEJA
MRSEIFQEEENDDDRSPLLRITDDLPAASPNAKYLELESCEDEMNWLRALYFDADMHRRRWMAALMFEIAQRAMFRFAPALANFERAQQKFDHLLTLHGKQRPLLDMMLTKIRGTYFMPLETNLFLYDAKLISFGELVDSEIHPKDWKNRRESLRKHRRQKPKQTSQIEEFFERQTADSDSDSASEIRSDPSSSMGSTESLNNSRRGKQARKEVSKAHREMILLKMRSKPANPDITFAKEKRAMGPKRWKTRRRLNETLEGIADLDRFKLELKLPAKKHHLLNYVTQLIVNNSDTAHWSWGDLKMQTRIGRIPPVHRMKSRHISRIKNGKVSG